MFGDVPSRDNRWLPGHIHHPPEICTMKLAFVSQTWPENATVEFAGSSVQVYYLVQEFARRGHEVLLILTHQIDPIQPPYPTLSIRTAPIVSGLRHHLRKSWQRFITDALSGFQPDIVYQRGKLPESVACSNFCTKNNALFVWLSNSDETGKPNKFLTKRRQHPKSNPILQAARIAEAMVADKKIEQAIRTAGMVIAQNTYQADLLRRNFGMNPIIAGSGHFIPPIVERAPTDEISVLWLANVTPVKQPLMFIELAEKLSGTPLRFTMAGAMQNKEVREEIERRTGLLPGFHLVGHVPFHQSNGLFQAADIFTHTSSSEGLPNTLLQACIHGVPIVSLKNDPDNLITRHGFGIVATSMEEFAQAVRGLAEDHQARKEMGRKGRKFAEEQYDIRLLVDKLTALFQQELARRNGVESVV